MSNYSNISDQLWSLTVSDLNKVKSSISEIILTKIKNSLSIGDEVYIVQKSKKDEGIVEKINKSRALVKIGHTCYHVPFTMIEIKSKDKRFETIDKKSHVINKDNMTSNYYSKPKN